MLHSLVETRQTGRKLATGGTWMRATSKIDSLSYGTVYLTGCVVAMFFSFSQGNPIQTLVFHTLCSWGYVVYRVLNFT
jgi:hypothetical protein